MFKCFNQTLQELNIIILIQINQSLMEESQGQEAEGNQTFETITMPDNSREIEDNSIETEIESNMTMIPASQQDNPIVPTIQFSTISLQSESPLEKPYKQQDQSSQIQRESQLLQDFFEGLYKDQTEKQQYKDKLKRILYNLHGTKINDNQSLIKILRQQQMIKQVPLSLLLKLAHLREEKQFHSNFEQEYPDLYKSVYEDSTCPLTVPIAKGFGKKFTNELFLWFFHEFQKEHIGKQDNGIQNWKTKDKQQESFYQFSMKQQYDLKEGPQQECQDLPKKQKKYPSTKQPQFNLPSKKQQKSVPANFYKTIQRNQRLSTKRLISLNVTSIFQQQIKDVQEIFETQINSEYLTKNYQLFLQRYQLFNLIKSGQEQSKQPSIQRFFSQYQSQYLSQSYSRIHFDDQKKSPILTYWETLMRNFEIILKQQPVKIQDIKKILKKRLQNITLYYTPGSFKQKICALTNQSGIFINISHIQGRLTVKEFQEGPLKPYILLNLYHELAHELIRQTFYKNIKEKKSLEDPNRSFELQEHTFGCQILKLAKKMTQEIKNVFQVIENIKLSNDFDQKRANSGLIKDIVVDLKLELGRFSPNGHQILKQMYPQICKVRQYLNTIQFIKDKIKQISIPLENWSELCLKISKRQKSDKISQQATQYAFIQALFKAQQHYSILKIQSQNYYKDAILAYYQGYTKTFRIKNTWVQDIVNEIKLKDQKFFKSEEVNMFIDLKLNENTHEDMVKIMKQLCTKWETNGLQQMIFGLKSILHIQSEKTKRILKFFNNKYKLGQNIDIRKLSMIIQAQQYYCTSMRFIKFSEVYQIASHLPDFIYYQSKQGVDSGFYFENMILPNLAKKKYIYAKDYEFLKALSATNASKVGLPPQSSEQSRMSIVISRERSGQERPGLDMNERVCQVHQFKYQRKFINEEALKNLKCRSESERARYQKEIAILTKIYLEE